MSEGALPLADRAGLTPAQRDAVLAAVGDCTTLGQLLERGRDLDPPLAVDGIVTQDEYTHDVLVPIPGGRWLVFDTT